MRLVGASPSAFSRNWLDAPLVVGRHDAVAGRVVDRVERQRHARAGALVLGELGGQVDVGQHVAVEHEQALLEHPLVEREAHRAGGAQRLLLDHVAQAHAVVDVAEHPLDAVGHEAAGEDHLVHAVAVQPVEHEGQERPPGQRHHRLGGRVGERPQPRALAAGEDQRLHLAPDALVGEAGLVERSRSRKLRPSTTSGTRMRSLTSPVQSSSPNSGHSVTSTTASAPSIASSAESQMRAPPSIALAVRAATGS